MSSTILQRHPWPLQESLRFEVPFSLIHAKVKNHVDESSARTYADNENSYNTDNQEVSLSCQAERLGCHLQNLHAMQTRHQIIQSYKPNIVHAEHTGKTMIASKHKPQYSYQTQAGTCTVGSTNPSVFESEPTKSRDFAGRSSVLQKQTGVALVLVCTETLEEQGMRHKRVDNHHQRVAYVYRRINTTLEFVGRASSVES